MAGLKLAALISGGKDSMLALHHAVWSGHEVAYLVVMHPKRRDSWMFHTQNLHMTELISEALGIPLASAETTGIKELELRDLERLLAGLDVEGVVSGAIASKYQKERIDRLCQKLGLEHIAPLWGREQEALLRELLAYRFSVIFVGVYAYGFSRSWLGRLLDEQAVAELMELNKRFAVSPVGEGGEYDTLVLDAPLYRKKIRIEEVDCLWEGESGTLLIRKATLVDKAKPR